ncbi:hypothetical protein P170DRAFT_455861 [Aspergillus steynii IBT 23096]|uniref:Fungal-type protein kinase domain-containing protein n=1 Tax=Aspergillus steynii IBT 23096 TaxID=1392250 RepID=A0A2I2G8E3_9EURO|nr:uncharacterized protein P170DRAFT_455861 [Aspergillus steynii IBT 23096]PLB49113.1 hypothetical protein P170DRAFT_455861 [Aspergillus steynii IBT 23096]
MADAPAISVPTIGDKLDGFRESFRSTCDNLGLPHSADALRQLDSEDLQSLALDLVSALRTLSDLRRRPSVNSRKSLLSDVLRLNSAISSDDFDTDQLVSLLSAIVNEESHDIIWRKIQTVLVESTPPPKSLPPIFVNSSEQRRHVDAMLKEELKSIYVGVQGFYEAYFGDIDGLEEAGAAVFRRCQEGQSPLFTKNGWRDWPENAKEGDVLDWLSTWIRHIRMGSTADRKLDIGIMPNTKEHHWSHILVLGELKSNPKADSASQTWRDLGRYAREVLTTQDTRRFILGFTLCGSSMRLWEFDRVGAIASSPFDINKKGYRFVSAMLGFLRMNDEQLGYDPSVISASDGKRLIEITRDGHSERLVLDSLIKRAPCVAGRATTCWKAHREGDESTPLVIKDSWQYPERAEEGKLLHEATEKGVVNVARYYHHETVQVNGKIDDVRNGIRRGLDVTKSTNHRATRPETTLAESDTADIERVGRSMGSSTGSKRSSSRAGATLPHSKRTCSSSPFKAARDIARENRVHRRVIIRDFGKPIYKASSHTTMLAALEGCVDGYQSLHMMAGLFQGDISTGNLMMNEEDGNPSWLAFLIDLDLAIKEDRTAPSGAQGKTGTRAFMAIGVLLGDIHSFMHDMESLFWFLFWICIHYDGPDQKGRLAQIKKGIVADEADFIEIAGKNFTSYHRPLIPWVNRLRKVVFPSGGRWRTEDRALYTRIKEVLQKAQKEPNVSKG